MKINLLNIPAFILLSAAAASASAASILDSLCTADRPVDGHVNQASYDLYCPGYISNRLAQEQADTDEAARKARRTERAEDEKAHDEEVKQQLDYLEKLGAKVKPNAPKLPDLASFSSSGKRHIADLAYTSGEVLATDLAAKVADKGQARVLIVANQDAAAYWMPQVDTVDVLARLARVKDAAAAISVRDCKVAVLATGDKTWLKQLKTNDIEQFSIATSAVSVGLDALALFAGMFRTELLGGTAVAAPDNLMGAVLAGFQHGWSGSEKRKGAADVFLVTPPTIGSDNSIKFATKAATEALVAGAKNLADQQEKSARKPPVADQDCVKKLAADLAAAKAIYDQLGKKEEGSVLGSLLDQAARQVAIEKEKITAIVQLDTVVAGGGVNGYQRNRFSAVKLVTAGDVAIAARWYAVPKGELHVVYDSRSCGKAVPLGKFAASYQADFQQARKDKSTDPMAWCK